jgi:hypothetical protein
MYTTSDMKVPETLISGKKVSISIKSCSDAGKRSSRLSLNYSEYEGKPSGNIYRSIPPNCICCHEITYPASEDGN